MLKFLGDKYRIGLKKMSKDNSKITKNRNKKNKTLSSSSSSSSSNNNSSSNSRGVKTLSSRNPKINFK